MDVTGTVESVRTRYDGTPGSIVAVAADIDITIDGDTRTMAFSVRFDSPLTYQLGDKVPMQWSAA